MNLSLKSTRLWLAGLVLATAGGAALTAFAQPGPRGGPDHGGPGMGMPFMGSPERIGRGVDRMLDGLGTSDAQRTQIKQIAQAAAADLKQQHEAGRALREQSMHLFTQPNVDAAAAENLRQQMVAQHDAASKRMLKAMLDVSSVLTPEQRVKLADRMKQRREHMAHRMHERGASAPTR